MSAEIAVDPSDGNVVLIRWHDAEQWLAVRPNGLMTREDTHSGIPVWDADAAGDIDEVIDAAYTTGYRRGHAEGITAAYAASRTLVGDDPAAPTSAVSTIRVTSAQGGSANVA